MMIFDLDRVENIVEKGESAGYQHVLIFPQCFQRACYPGSLKLKAFADDKKIKALKNDDF